MKNDEKNYRIDEDVAMNVIMNMFVTRRNDVATRRQWNGVVVISAHCYCCCCWENWMFTQSVDSVSFFLSSSSYSYCKSKE